VLPIAIRYYLVANEPDPVNLSVALAQVVLELVAHAWLSQKDNWTNNSMACNFRALLTDLGVPLDIPRELSALRTAHQGDGPSAVIRFRKDVIHQRGGTTPLAFRAIFEASKLGVWYIELALLRLCDFHGLYRNRVTGATWEGTVEKVPWA
jgi:hypothetical protein